MIKLTEEQKTLLFYALAAIQRTLYFDDDLEQIDYNYNNYRLDINALNTITHDIKKLDDLIEKTLDDLC